MNIAEKLHTQYITNEKGERVSVVIPIEEYALLLEDVQDLAAVAERREEPAITHADLIRRLKADGLL
ncbi:MAG: hypothetical protein HY273_05525 [Gammaproteobacteria bacterium]|nr:hypothetical protein [Gammaproteobacteria bacterium]